jgi:hypothetical protein
LSNPLVFAVDDVQELLIGRLGHPGRSRRRDPFHRPLSGDGSLIGSMAR